MGLLGILLVCLCVMGRGLAEKDNLCPEIINCFCSMEMNLREDVFKVDCSNRELKKFPDLSKLEQKRIFLDLSKNRIDDAAGAHAIKGADVIILDLSHNRLAYGMIDGVFKQNVQNLKRLYLTDVPSVDLSRGQLTFLRGLSKLEELTMNTDLGQNEPPPEIRITKPLFDGLMLDSLDKLFMKNRGISWASRDAFNGLPNLRRLSLGNNRFTTVPSDIFTSLEKLHRLYLDNNRIKILQAEDFVTTRDLFHLDLSHNFIDKIDADVFKGLDRTLGELLLGGNKLDSIPRAAITNMQRLKTLDVSTNLIGLLEREDLIGAYQLRELKIGGNPLQSFPLDMFDGVNDTLTSLGTRLFASDGALPIDTLDRLLKLEKFDLSEGYMTEIPDLHFDGLAARLRDINLSGMAITTAGPRAFHGLTKGLRVNLDDNAITSLNFILDIPPCTMRELSVKDNNIACDCSIYKIVATGHVGHGKGKCFKEKKEYELSSHSLFTLLGKECRTDDAVVKNECWREWQTTDPTTGFTPLTISLVLLVCAVISSFIAKF